MNLQVLLSLSAKAVAIDKFSSIFCPFQKKKKKLKKSLFLYDPLDHKTKLAKMGQFKRINKREREGEVDGNRLAY